MPTKIEWSDETWNPVTGCSKVSAGCKHCYAEREWPRMTRLVSAYAGRDFTDVRTHADRLDQPLRWKKPRMIFVNSMSDLFHPDVPFEFIAAVFGVMASAPNHTFQILTKRPSRMLDFFKWIEEKCRGANDRYISSDRYQKGVKARQEMRDKGGPWLSEPPPPNEMLRGLYDIATPIINAQMNKDSRYHHLRRVGEKHWRKWPLENVWIGVSVEDQAAADERISLLLDTPAAVRWISAEPLLGPVRLSSLFGLITDDEDVRVDALNGTFVTSRYQEEPNSLGARLDWVVVGGESGPKARPVHPQWARDLRDQCAAAGVPFMFKQWGEWAPGEVAGPNERAINAAYWFNGQWDIRRVGKAREDDHIDDEPDMFLIGKKASGRTLDGEIHDGYPVSRHA